MDNNDIISLFNTLTEDSLDSDIALILLNQAEEELEQEREWEILKKIDSSQTASSGDTYLSMKSLPSDFGRPISTAPPTILGVPFYPVQFEKRELYKNSANKCYFYYKTSQFAMIGVGGGGTIYLPYIYSPLDLALTADATHLDTPVWPSRFRPILAYRMAEIFQGNIDADDISYRMSSKQMSVYRVLRNSMKNWDSSLKIGSMNWQAGYDESVGDPIS